MDEKELKSRAEKYAEQMGRMAAEAGKALDRAMSILETESKQMYEDISRGEAPYRGNEETGQGCHGGCKE